MGMGARIAERTLFHVRAPLIAGRQALLPVSALADLDPDEYARAIAKYDDTPARRRLRDTRIPHLDCAWTDAVFLSPVHPHAVWSAWREITGRERPPKEFWAVPVDAVRGETVVLDRLHTKAGEPFADDEVRPFDAATFRTAHSTTPGNRQWLEHLALRGASGAWFQGVPYVATIAEVPLDDARVIDWRDPVVV